MRNLYVFFSALFLCIFSLNLLTAFEVAEAAERYIHSQHLANLQKTYSEFSSIVFSFEQITRSGSRSRSGHGDAVFVRLPGEIAGIMRWNYIYPDFQIILNDGKELSIYNRRDKQMIVTPAEEFNNDITFGLFAGDRALTDDFIAGAPLERFIFFLAGVNLTAIHLLPSEPHPQIKSVQIWFDEHYLIRHLVLVDHFESITELAFSENIINSVDVNDSQEMAKILFFDISEGTEIIRP